MVEQRFFDAVDDLLAKVLRRPWLFFLVLAVLLNPDLLLGPFQYIRAHDTLADFAVPFQMIGQHMMRKGFLLWYPWTLGGHPALGFGFGFFHPGVLLAGVGVPLWMVLALLTLVLYTLAGYGMFSYLRENLRLSPLASVAGGVFMMYLHYFHSRNLSISMIYFFPYFLFLLGRFFNVDRFGKCRDMLIIALFFSTTFPPTTIPFFPVAHLLMILGGVRPFQETKKHFLLWGLVWGFYAILHAPDIQSVLVNLPESHRQIFNAVRGVPAIPTPNVGSVLLRRVLHLFSAPDFFMRFVPMAFALSTIFFVRRRIIAFWFAYAFCFYALGVFTSSHWFVQFQSHFGVFKSILLERFSSVYGFILCVLAAHGVWFYELLVRKNDLQGALINRWTSLKTFRGFIFLVLSVSVLLSIVNAFLYPTPGVMGKTLFFVCFPALFCVALFVGLWRLTDPSIQKRWVRCGLVFLAFYCFGTVSADLLERRGGEKGSYHYFFTNPAAQTIQAKGLSTAPPFRVVMMGVGHPPYLNSQGLETADGNVNLYSRRYKLFWAKLIEPGLSKEPGWEIGFYQACKAYLFSESSFPDRRSSGDLDAMSFHPNLLALLNVKYIFSRSLLPWAEGQGFVLKISGEKGTPDSLRNGWHLKAYFQQLLSDPTWTNMRFRMSEFISFWFVRHADYWVYEVPDPLPRAFVVSHWEKVKTKEDALNVLLQLTPLQMRQHIVLINDDVEKCALPLSQNSPLPFSAQVVEEEPERWKLICDAPVPGILVLLNNFHQNWQVRVNGQKARVFPVDETFMGTSVPAGKSLVEFVYESPVELWLNRIVLFIFALLVTTVGVLWRKKIQSR